MEAHFSGHPSPAVASGHRLAAAEHAHDLDLHAAEPGGALAEAGRGDRVGHERGPVGRHARGRQALAHGPPAREVGAEEVDAP